MPPFRTSWLYLHTYTGLAQELNLGNIAVLYTPLATDATINPV